MSHDCLDCVFVTHSKVLTLCWNTGISCWNLTSMSRGNITRVNYDNVCISSSSLFVIRLDLMNRKAHVACNFNCLFETGGLLAVTSSQVRGKRDNDGKRCKMETSLMHPPLIGTDTWHIELRHFRPSDLRGNFAYCKPIQMRFFRELCISCQYFSWLNYWIVLERESGPQ